MSSSSIPYCVQKYNTILNKFNCFLIVNESKQNQKHKKAKEFWQLYFVSLLVLRRYDHCCAPIPTPNHFDFCSFAKRLGKAHFYQGVFRCVVPDSKLKYNNENVIPFGIFD